MFHFILVSSYNNLPLSTTIPTFITILPCVVILIIVQKCHHKLVLLYLRRPFIPELGGLVFIPVMVCTGVHRSVELPPQPTPESLHLRLPPVLFVYSTCCWDT